MTRLSITALSIVALLVTLPAPAQTSRALHDRIITFDAEMDIPFKFMNAGNDVRLDTAMQVDLPKMDRSGLDGALFVSWVLQEARSPSAYAKTRVDAETVVHYVDSIDYVVNLLGIDPVFISSDMEHGGGVTGWKNAGEAFAVTEEIIVRGYTEDQIAKLWWGNFARIWRGVEAVAGG